MYVNWCYFYDDLVVIIVLVHLSYITSTLLYNQHPRNDIPVLPEFQPQPPAASSQEAMNEGFAWAVCRDAAGRPALAW